MKWHRVEIQTGSGIKSAIAPLIISASRSTDIPAFYPKWFINRVRVGYSKWINPFNQRETYISFSKCKVVVFWTKNPKPLIPYLEELNSKNIKYYFQFTLNNYEKEGLEPHVPPLSERIDSFKALSNLIGRERIIWRYDPFILSHDLSVAELCERVEYIATMVAPFTEKLVFSFADIDDYAKVKRNLKSYGFNYKNFTENDIMQIASKIAHISKQHNISVATCAEDINLSDFNIQRNKCIDDDLILKLCPADKDICQLLGCNFSQHSLIGDFRSNRMKDPGQRESCGCIVSKDIGQYNTCGHLCVYCYANYSPEIVRRNRFGVSDDNESILI